MSLRIRGLVPLLQIYDMAASLDFYHRILKFKIVTTSGPADDVGWALLRKRGIELMLNTTYEAADRPKEADLARTRAHGDTTLYFASADVDGAYEHLKKHGLGVAPPAIAAYGMKQVFVHDPDGYLICFQTPADP